MQDPETPSFRKLATLMVLAIGAAILLLLLAAEAAVRVRQHLKYGSVATLEEQFTLDPALALRVPVAGFKHGRVSVNRLGFRGDEVSLPKPAGTLRLAFLGASTTWCAEVSGNEHVWPHQVARDLRSALPGVNVDYVNAGVPGYTLASMLKSMQGRVAPLQPDVVVIYEGTNDLTGEMRSLAARKGVISSDRFQEMSEPSRYSLLWHLAEKNLRVLAAERAIQAPSSRLDIDARTLGQSYRAALTKVVREAQRHAKVVAVATFSTQPRHGQTAQQKVQASSSALYYMPFLQPDTIIAAYERYNDIAREVAHETGALLIDGEHVVPGDALHFHDTVHFTDRGSAAMARRVSRALLSSGQLQSLLQQ